jgi:hypothetical protein
VSGCRWPLTVRFVGEDGSLGYRHGQVYGLTLSAAPWRPGPTILAPTPCPYESWRAFWRNWEPVH